MANDTLKNFKQKYEQVNIFKNKLEKLIKKGQEIGVQFNPDLLQKFDKLTFDMNDNEKLKVVLIGGFSEGKTSIAAAWLGKYDPKTMNINQQESTDMISVYDIDSDLILIDTPGLYGYTERLNDQNEIEKYKDITRKYADEAHIILYVMDSSNPIKDSHKGELFWLFRTLGLLNRTVFVLSKFDLVVDLESEELYKEELKIKKNNVIERLSSIIALTPEEIKEIQIVGVSANPDDEGTEYWLENIEEFDRLSRINTLQDATNNIIGKNNGKFGVLYDAQKLIIDEIITDEIPALREKKEELDEAIEYLEEHIKKYERDIDNVRKDIVTSSIEMRRFIIDYFTELILDARKCDFDTIQSYLETKIGPEGSVITNTIECKITEEAESICGSIKTTAVKFEEGLRQSNSLMKELGTNGAKYLIKNKDLINSKNIIAIRDGAVALAQKIGLNIGKSLKFKPWGAVKWAKNLKGLLEVIGIALELWQAWDEKKKEEEFQNAIDKLVKELGQMRDAWVDIFKSENFAEEYFPNYVQLKDDLKLRKEALVEQRNQQDDFEKWCTDFNKLDSEYRRLG